MRLKIFICAVVLFSIHIKSIEAQLDLKQVVTEHFGYVPPDLTFNFVVQDYQLPIKGYHDRNIRYFKNEWINNVELIEKPKADFDYGYTKKDLIMMIHFQKRTWKKLPKRFRERLKRMNEKV